MTCFLLPANLLFQYFLQSFFHRYSGISHLQTVQNSMWLIREGKKKTLSAHGVREDYAFIVTLPNLSSVRYSKSKGAAQEMQKISSQMEKSTEVFSE